MSPKYKILAIQFKYLGDAVFMTPALQAIHLKYPDAEIHILVAEEVAPIFEHLAIIKKVWPLPRTRYKELQWTFLYRICGIRSGDFDYIAAYLIFHLVAFFLVDLP